jgi:chemotaxis protein CheD
MTVRSAARDTVFLRPGELYFGGPGGFIETILGSCVSVTIWHPGYLLGGMCHYVLPEPTLDEHRTVGHSAPDAIEELLDRAREAGTHVRQYEVKMFGGGIQFEWEGPQRAVGHRNVDAGLRLLAEHGLSPKTLNVRGVGHRRITLDLGTGSVWMPKRQGAAAVSLRQSSWLRAS